MQPRPRADTSRLLFPICVFAFVLLSDVWGPNDDYSIDSLRAVATPHSSQDYEIVLI